MRLRKRNVDNTSIREPELGVNNKHAFHSSKFITCSHDSITTIQIYVSLPQRRPSIMRSRAQVQYVSVSKSPLAR